MARLIGSNEQNYYIITVIFMHVTAKSVILSFCVRLKIAAINSLGRKVSLYLRHTSLW